MTGIEVRALAFHRGLDINGGNDSPSGRLECRQPGESRRLPGEDAAPRPRGISIQHGFRPVDGSSLQQWALQFTPSGGTHYRFLNADGWCLSTDSLRNGDPVLADECTVGSNGTVSNAEWNASSTIIDNQAIFVSLQSRLGFVNRAECLDEPGALAGNSNMQMWVCNGTSAQRWLVESNS